MILVVIAAIADNGVIGRDNKLIWRLRSDLRRFRALTWGKPLIMGRRTFQSIGRPLPGRETVVLTRDPAFSASGVHVARSWNEARQVAADLGTVMGADEAMVVGGAEVYALALPEVERLHLTLVHAEPEGDTLFPSFDSPAFGDLRREDHPAGPDDEHPFTFVDLERRPAAAGR